MSHANRVNGVVPGRRLKFVKGKWYIGDDLANPNDDYYADLFTIVTCWEIWHNGQIIDMVIAEVGKPLPARKTLGHNDQYEWELGLDGRPKDPCQETHYVQLIRCRDGEKFSYGTSSHGGKKAIADLADAGSVRPEEVAIVSLESSEYKNKKFGHMVQVPDLKPRRWVRASELENKQQIDDKKQIEVPAGEKANTSFHVGADPDDDLPF